MKNFVTLLKDKLQPKAKSFGGFFVGEKVLFCAMQEKFIYLCGDFVSASKLKSGLKFCDKKVEIISCGRENEDERDVNLQPFAKSVASFLRGELDGLIFLPSSLTTKFDLKFLQESQTLEVGQEIEIEKLAKNLVGLGFEKTDYVSMPGQFAVRGDVVDIFVEDVPTRIEFFDEEIEKILNFDFSTMKTTQILKKVDIYPIYLKDGKNIVLELCPSMTILDEPQKIQNECQLLKRSREELSWNKQDTFLNFEQISTEKYICFSNTTNDEFENKTIGQKNYITDFMSLKKDILMYVQSGVDVYLFAGEFFGILQEFLITNNVPYTVFDYNENGDNYCDNTKNSFDVSAIEKNTNPINSIKKDINSIKSDINIIENDENSIKNHEILLKNGKNFDNDVKTSKSAKIYLCHEYFPYSFSFLSYDIIGIGTDDMYKSHRVEFKGGKQNFSYLPKVGDFVVHSFYGIGRCKDIVRMKLSHFEKDYFVIEYKNGALLYLPSEQANLLSAYVGGEEPKLNTLGSSEWTKLKQKVKQDLKEVAIELAKIYKERETKKGFKFVRDEELEKDFSDAFEFVLTPDQVDAIADVDKDMESEKIMDRLICGDVGFGKTEVAFRAIFKAIYNGKQVALLCPTTILSEQHYRSATQRMSNFGVRIEVLNRFKTAKETSEIYERVKKGEVDLIIGTHKILNDKLQFKDLGLLVLDEEQRFGVKDKEKIKKIKSDIDVLTLSATPIPRTLHLSLSGIRDISVIATPPRDRLPIQTYVSAYSDGLLKDVVLRELSRKGKALVLYNKVSSIYEFKNYVSMLLPQASIGVMHGQMEEKELLRVINDLYEDKFNLLISTTLIENGIDLPTLNTLFVLDCDMLGLSQLYQIRGRIGRSDKLAYAYLTYDGGKVLTEEAYKRLDAIKEFRELGSGFKIATRDLEIRGAGNILGKQQHGQMQKVGYDMYVRLLEEVTKEASGQKSRSEKEIQMELVLDAFISEEYISSQEERIVFYDKISKISNQNEFNSVIKQLEELSGFVPIEVKNLCKIAYLKNLAENFNVKKIRVNERDCLVYFYKNTDIIDKRLSKIVGLYDACLKFEDVAILKVNTKGKVSNKVDLLIEIFSKALQEIS